MADTIVSNSPSSDSGAGWFFALVLIIILAVGGVVLYQRGFFNDGSRPADTTNIQVTVPNPVAPAQGGANQ